MDASGGGAFLKLMRPAMVDLKSRRRVNSTVMRYILHFSSVLVLTLATSIFPNVALACSGLGVGALVDANIRFSVQMFAVACFLFVAIAALYMYRKKRVGLVVGLIAAVILALHPVWTVSAYSGDCGGSKAMYSLKATGVLGVLFLVQLALFVFTFVWRRRA